MSFFVSLTVPPCDVVGAAAAAIGLRSVPRLGKETLLSLVGFNLLSLRYGIVDLVCFSARLFI